MNLQRIVGQIIDEVLETPALVSVMRVSCDRRLTHANVGISVYGDDADVDQTMDYLLEHTNVIRREISARAELRRTPEIHFYRDDSLAAGQSMLELLSNS